MRKPNPKPITEPSEEGQIVFLGQDPFTQKLNGISFPLVSRLPDGRHFQILYKIILDLMARNNRDEIAR